jgi:hypothetical protein
MSSVKLLFFFLYSKRRPNIITVSVINMKQKICNTDLGNLPVSCLYGWCFFIGGENVFIKLITSAGQHYYTTQGQETDVTYPVI